MKRVLVTGAGGFIGKHAVAGLVEHGFKVDATASRSLNDRRTDCTWHVVNLLDPTQVKELIAAVRPTHLLHLAWYAVPGKYWTALENFQWVQASLELLRQFQTQGGQRALMAGTCAEYDWSYGYCSESITPRNPDSPYGVCKHAFQEMLRAYSEISGLSSAWGRIFFLYGPYEYQNRLVPSVIRSLLNEEPAHCSYGNQIRDFLYVQDVADAFVALLDSEIEGPVNIASGQPITIKSVINKIAVKIERPDLVQLGAIPAAAKDPPLLVADVRRLTNEVGWMPQYNLEKGLDHTIGWWKNKACRSGL